MKFEKNQILEIEWEDAATVGGWHSEDKESLIKDDGLCLCKTVGYFLRETKRSIQLSSSINTENDRGETSIIPKSCVIEIRLFVRK